MLYLVGQIILCLMFTALVGVAVGWLLRGLGTARQTDAVEARWRARVVQLEQQTAAQRAIPAAETEQQARPAAPAERTVQAPADNEQTEALRRRLAERERELATLRTAQAVRKQPRPVDELVERVRESQQLCQQLQGHLGDQRAANAQLVKQLELAQTERDTLIMRLRDNESEIGQLSTERQQAIATIANLQKELRALRGALASTASPRPAAPPGRAVDAKPAARAPLRPAPPKPPAQQEMPIANATATRAPYQPAWRLPTPQGKRDNLQAIYGIGPKLEARLNQLGVFHFHQIASFGRDDILWVAERLEAFPGRILRDRWVEQARSLSRTEPGPQN